MAWEPAVLIGTASAIAAWLALILSLVNVRRSRRALRLSERQEERRKPSLVVYLQEGFTSANAQPGIRVYALLLSVSNRSDNNNAVAEAILHLTYSKQRDNELTVKFLAKTEIPIPFQRALTRLSLPTRIDAHQTISGWYFFCVDNAILQGAKVERTIVVLRDSHGNEVTIEPMLLREYSDENEKQSN
jgi:hypothetical protein